MRRVAVVALLGGWAAAAAARPDAAARPAPADAGGFQLVESGRMPAEARADYDSAMRLLEARQYEPAIALLQKVTQKAPAVATAHVDLGIAYARAGDLDRAVATLRHAIEISPHQPVAYNELGIVYRRKGEFAAARQSYEQALAAYPGFHYARLNLAILCDVYLGDAACARDNYLAYQRLVPDDERIAAWIADLDQRAGR